MNISDLTAEAEKLARTGSLLRKIGFGDPVAYWHAMGEGEPCVSFRSGPRWLTVHLESAGGVVSSSEEPCRSRVPLYAEPYVSLPPVDAVFLLGSETVERYLQKYDWPRNEPLNGNFPGEVAHEYQALWQQNCPLYRNDVAAAVGGWNMPWPDGDFENIISSELLIWTFEEAEPWIEVFRSGATHRVFQRIT